MKTVRFFIITIVAIISCNSTIYTSAQKSSAGSKSQQEGKPQLIDTSTKFGRDLNTSLIAMGTVPESSVITKLNAVLAKGKELHEAATALNKALPLLREGDRLAVNAGKTCWSTSTIDPVKGVTPAYLKEKKQQCDSINHQFPNAHERFEAHPQGAVCLKKQQELVELNEDFFNNAPVEVQMVIGTKLAEIGTIANLIFHFAPAASE